MNHALRASLVGLLVLTAIAGFILVNPFAATAAANLVTNGDFETANGALPLGWAQGGWGTNTRTFTYPAAGMAGNGGKLQVTAFTSGDAKWYFTPVAVTPGTTYTFQDDYQSTGSSFLTIQYETAAQVYSYAALTAAPASAGFSHITRTFTPPAGVVKATVFHGLSAVGTLTIDNASVTSNATSTDTVVPTVSVTAPAAGATISGTVTVSANATDNVAVAGVQFLVDGVATGAEDLTAPYSISLNTATLSNGAHSISARARDTSANTATSGTVAVTVSNVVVIPPSGSNLITNGTFETPNGASPQGWAQGGWGTLTRTFTYPSVGAAGNGAKLQVTAFTSGDAKWYFTPVAVTPGTVYTFQDDYQATGSSFVTVQYETATPTYSYLDLGAAPASAGFTHITRTFTPPAGTVKATVFHGLNSVGTLTIDNASLTVPGGATSTPDTTKPLATLTSPANAATLSGTASFSATASDNIAVAGVRFIVDGVPFGVESTTAPYTISVNTTSIANGSHTVYAQARDAAGNIGTSTTATFTVSNSTTTADTTKPTVALTSPTANATVVGTSTSLTATASDNVAVTQVTFFVDGSSYGVDTVAPYSMVFDTTLLVNGSHTVYAEAKDAANNAASTTPISVTVNNPVPDTQAPVVSITQPTTGSILAATTTLVFAASDNVAVTAVHYEVSNGIDHIVGELTAAPYTVQIPIKALKNGSHTITAYATDAANNIGNASTVTFNTFYIPPAPQNPNLIQNPSLETATVVGVPDHWFQGGWGTSSTTFSYPVAGIDGAAAADVSMANRTDGDAKWYFEDVAVTPGQVYEYSNQYKSTATSTLTARYTLADNSFVYSDITLNIAPSASWTSVLQAFTPPASSTKVTIFHLINGNGSLTIDNAALRLQSASTIDPGPNGFPAGFVTITFDDGWGSQYDTAYPMLNAAGLKGSFFIITKSMQEAINQNRVDNPSFEVSLSTTTPANWSAIKTGVSTTTFTFPVAGVLGAKAAKLDVTSLTSGSAQWQPDEMTLVSAEAHNYTDRYMATVPTTVSVRYTLTNNTTQTVDLGTVPASAVWATAAFTFVPPANTKTVTVYHKIAAVGSLTVDDVHLDIAQDYMNTAQVQQIFGSGHEVSSHTRTHPFLTTLSAASATDEILGARQDLNAIGITPADTFVYPYGDYNATTDSIVKSSGYLAARTVDQGYNNKATDKYKLMIQEVNASTTAATWQQWTETAMTNHTWLILMYHQIDHQNDQYGATPEDFQTYVNYLVANGIPVVTMKQGLAQMNP